MITGSEITDCYHNGTIFQLVHDSLDNNKLIDDLLIPDRGW